jgi:hypothetical protein
MRSYFHCRNGLCLFRRDKKRFSNTLRSYHQPPNAFSTACEAVKAIDNLNTLRFLPNSYYFSISVSHKMFSGSRALLKRNHNEIASHSSSRRIHTSVCTSVPRNILLLDLDAHASNGPHLWASFLNHPKRYA